MQTFDTIIIGAGINGCTLAYTLNKKGHNVLVLEQDTIASGGSGAAVADDRSRIDLEIHRGFSLPSRWQPGRHR